MATGQGAGDDATRLSAEERDYLRRELTGLFGSKPSVRDGFVIKTRRTGPDAGAPKVPPAARSLLDRGLARLSPGSPWHTLHLTDAGVAAVREMLRRPRGSDREELDHVRRELGLVTDGDTPAKP